MAGKRPFGGAAPIGGCMEATKKLAGFLDGDQLIVVV